ncbi:MAG: hypothetical protein M3345_02695 [Actinomycetota bacterium]|nr:hypothetical protein [Actinomycetota bacterium]
MLKRILLVLIGAAGALEGEQVAQKLTARYRPSAVTGTLLDKLNQRLEGNRIRAGSGDGPQGPLP